MSIAYNYEGEPLKAGDTIKVQVINVDELKRLKAIEVEYKRITAPPVRIERKSLCLRYSQNYGLGGGLKLEFALEGGGTLELPYPVDLCPPAIFDKIKDPYTKCKITIEIGVP